jgi:tripartite-type tricarboxylate transporter receptor subunit TctC
MTLSLPRVLSRRFLCASTLAAAASPLCAEPERSGQNWPRRPVRLLTRPADGERGDAMARTLGVALSWRWRQPVTVDYRPGGDAAAVEAFLAARDDHVLLLAPAGVWTTLHLTHNDLTFDAARDLVPLAPLVQDFIALAAAPARGFAALGEVVEAARRNPGGLSWTSALPEPRLAFQGFLRAHQLELAFVPGRGSRGLAADLADGRLDLAFLPLMPIGEAVQSGKVRLIAVTGTERAPGAPAVPTVGEAGFPSLAMFNGHGLFGSRDLAEAARARIADDVATTLRDRTVAERLIRIGYRPQVDPPATFHARLARERVRWSEVAQATSATTAAQ